MKRWQIACLIVLLAAAAAAAEARPMKIKFGCYACGAHFTCPCDGWVCFNPYPCPAEPADSGLAVSGGIALGNATPEEAAAGIGDVDVTITPGGKVHFVFHRNLEIPAASDSLLPVDTVVLPVAVANALGYGSVTLVEGHYPVTFDESPYGEADVDAILTEPLSIPTLSEWSLIILALLVSGAIVWTVIRRRRLSAA